MLACGKERCASICLECIVAMQSKVDKLNNALKSSQKQAKQADSEVQEMEKAFHVLQNEVSAAAITCSMFVVPLGLA